MEIELLNNKKISYKLQQQLTMLYKELNAELRQLSLEEILQEPEGIDIACCFDNDQVVGIAMMANYKVISGHKGMVEDVVVFEKYRGQGLGRKLMEKLLNCAIERKLDEVLLFSGHHRTTAINLYKSLGFKLKNSGLYVKKLV
ncbi:GNAT family N-acetyltransferase [Maribacter sp. CXY002]|uniref:GNAT family N-acetyltransferase n=1 Tax=Maribacter luteocoastalis TaxID=3407671 RepID=UPI003B681F84